MFRPSSVVEALESRRFLSASPIHLSGGTLLIKAYADGANEISLARHSADGTIAIDVSATSAKNGQLSESHLIVQESSVRRVIVVGGRYGDTISVGAIDPDFLLPVSILGGKGNNIILTGAGDDSIITGDGNDNIDAGDGNNVVLSGKGDDTIATGIGKDRIAAGDGNDWIDSGAGNDLIRAGAGNDMVLAGDGDDIVHGQRGDDILHGGNGNDTLWGGLGDDAEYGEAGDDTLGGVLGNNTLIGGDGHDRFITRESSTNSTDLNSADDILSLIKKKDDGDDAISV